MKLSLGAAAYLVPFVAVAAGERVVAANYADHLSNVVVGIVTPFVASQSETRVDGPLEDETPRAALVMTEEPELESIAEAPTAGKKPKQKQGAKIRSGEADRLPSIHIPARRVLELANAGRRPSGRSVTAEGDRPAGVQVFGASALGVGVRDGDVITRVNGVAVNSANQVIALVIAARGARQPAISATVYRGQRRYTLTVEQPYLNNTNDSPRAEVDVPQSDGAGS